MYFEWKHSQFVDLQGFDDLFFVKFVGLNVTLSCIDFSRKGIIEVKQPIKRLWQPAMLFSFVRTRTSMKRNKDWEHYFPSRKFITTSACGMCALQMIPFSQSHKQKSMTRVPTLKPMTVLHRCHSREKLLYSSDAEQIMGRSIMNVVNSPRWQTDIGCFVTVLYY